MKVLCIQCDAQMHFQERQEPGDGTFAASFQCPECGHAVAMLANPMETQLVGALGVEIGGEETSSVSLEKRAVRLTGSLTSLRSFPISQGLSPSPFPR